MDYLESVKKQFLDYKLLGEKTISQLSEEQLNWQYNEESNSISTIVKHLSGNMLSRWTDFLESDGEKTWRNRDVEFEVDLCTHKEIKEYWDKGWQCLMDTLNILTVDDLSKIIYIRNTGQTVSEAINRQLAHYAYHIGQMVYIGKMLISEKWISLSIPKGGSEHYNHEKFSKSKSASHLPDEDVKENRIENNH